MLIWDHTAEKPLWHYPTYALKMQDIRFNVDRSRLAVGVSYGWEHSKDAPLTLFGGGCGCGELPATVWVSMRRSKVRGRGDGKRGDGERRGGQR